MAATFLSAIVGVPTGALAQESSSKPGLALNRFNPAPVGDRMFGVQSPYVAGDLTPHAALVVDYARDPLVLRNAEGVDVGSIVGEQVYAYLNASFAFRQRILLNLQLPFVLYQSGDNPYGGGIQYVSPSSADFGDVRVSTRVRLLGEYWDPFQLAVGGYVWLPTGRSEPDSYIGAGARALPQVIAGGRVQDRFVWSFDLGPDLRRSVTYGNYGSVTPGVIQGSMLRTGAGIGVLLGGDRNLQIGTEIATGFALDDANDEPFRRLTYAELMVNSRYRFGKNFEVGASFGKGLTSAPGTPNVRVVGMIAYTPRMEKPAPPKPKDGDGDGIVDEKDACVGVKGIEQSDSAKNGCPADSDSDGVTDAKDACMQVAGVSSDDPAKNGCPPDDDSDGVPNTQDACPQVKGVPHPDKARNGCAPDGDDDGVADANDVCPQIRGLKTGDPATNGCPGDTDADGVRDDVDACLDKAGPPNADPKRNGCPEEAIRVTETEVVITQQVQFDKGTAVIQPISFKLLDEVAGVLKEHTEITKIEVQGHSDDKGSAVLNKNLSQGRAESVRKALIQRGVEAERLIPKGYGHAQPIASNETEEGRAKNRRVQFVILEKGPKGSAPPAKAPKPAPTKAPAPPKTTKK